MTTPLRRQLRSAARAYRATRYPGDLAAEMLPAEAPMSSSGATDRPIRTDIAPAIGALAAAAAVLLALLLTPAASPPAPRVTVAPPAHPPHATLLPLRPGADVPVPAVHLPSLPARVPGPLPQGLDVEQYRMRYADLARQVPPLAPSLRRLTVPNLTDLPDKGFDWLHKVWTADESA